MEIALVVLLGMYTLFALLKIPALFLVPYETRVKQIALTYKEGVRGLGIRDDMLLLFAMAVVGMLAVVDLHHLSLITGFVAGGIVIQVFFHRFNRVLPEDKTPEPPVRPVQHLSYAIQVQPALGWREHGLWTAFYGWALFMLISNGLLG